MHSGPPRKLAPEIFWKALGLLALFAYFSIHSPFLDWEGIVAYLAATLGVAVASEFGIAPALRRLDPAQPDDAAPRLAQPRARTEVRAWRDSLLALGEDGLCFVPLLLAGANPVTAEVAAVAVAALHFPEYRLKHCVWKGLHVFVVAIVVLPYGLGSVAIGHLIALAIAFRFNSLEFLHPVGAAGGGRSPVTQAVSPQPPQHEAPR